jgi:hypothetical protein
METRVSNGIQPSGNLNTLNIHQRSEIVGQRRRSLEEPVIPPAQGSDTCRVCVSTTIPAVIFRWFTNHRLCN